MNPFLLSAFIIFGYMILLFGIATIKKNNGVADIGWGLGAVIVALVTYFVYSGGTKHQQLITYLVFLWGMRLSAYIALRSWGKPEDFRYANWRKAWGERVLFRSFFQVFMLQGAILFIHTLPIIIINAYSTIYSSYKWLYPLGTAVWLLGFLIEGVSDKQMYEFKNDPHPHKQKVMNKGLWKYSRHPNYFGECLVWWGVFLIAIPSGYWYISALAPITITYLLLKVSGVTMLEKKYEGDDQYSEYKRTTSAFVPWLPKSAK
jgi:steroid 5-alpha reductase family enzyme